VGEVGPERERVASTVDLAPESDSLYKGGGGI